MFEPYKYELVSELPVKVNDEIYQHLGEKYRPTAPLEFFKILPGYFEKDSYVCWISTIYATNSTRVIDVMLYTILYNSTNQSFSSTRISLRDSFEDRIL